MPFLSAIIILMEMWVIPWLAIIQMTEWSCQVHFHTFNSRQGKPWGIFCTDTNAMNEHGGPSYHEPSPTSYQCAYKVSVNGERPKAVLLARLRFPPDSVEPTSLWSLDRAQSLPSPQLLQLVHLLVLESQNVAQYTVLIEVHQLL